MKSDARSVDLLSAWPMPARDHIQGSVDAPIILLEYGDYECPYCAEAHPVVQEIQKRLGGTASMERHPFSLTVCAMTEQPESRSYLRRLQENRYESNVC